MIELWDNLDNKIIKFYHDEDNCILHKEQDINTYVEQLWN